MRILHLITWLQPGGIEKWLLSMLEQIPRSRYAMDFCCKGPHTGNLTPSALAQGAQVYHCPLGPDHIRYIRGLRRILREGQYNIIHNHLEAYSGLPVWIVRGKIPVISSYHNTHFAAQTWTRTSGIRELRSLYSQHSICYALKHSDYVTGCSGGVLTSLNPQYAEKDNYRVLYYGVSIPDLPTKTKKALFREQFGWPADTPIILHVGRFHEQKNHPGLLDIFERVRAVIPETKLLLVGDGPLRPTIEAAIARRLLQDHVRLLGLRDDVPDLMTQCDLFLFPSFYEGFGLVALEANAAALPVVGSKVPGLEEAVVDGQTASLFDPHDTEAMAAAATRILLDRVLASSMGMAGRQRAEAEFSLQASAKRLVDLYDECLE